MCNDRKKLCRPPCSPVALVAHLREQSLEKLIPGPYSTESSSRSEALCFISSAKSQSTSFLDTCLEAPCHEKSLRIVDEDLSGLIMRSDFDELGD